MNDADIAKAFEIDPDMAPHYKRLTGQFLDSIGWSPSKTHEFEATWYSIVEPHQKHIIAVILHNGTVAGAWNATFHDGKLRIQFEIGPEAINLGKQLVDSIQDPQ